MSEVYVMVTICAGRICRVLLIAIRIIMLKPNIYR